MKIFVKGIKTDQEEREGLELAHYGIFSLEKIKHYMEGTISLELVKEKEEDRRICLDADFEAWLSCRMANISGPEAARFVWPGGIIDFDCKVYIDDNLLTVEEKSLARVEVGRRVMSIMGVEEQYCFLSRRVGG